MATHSVPLNTLKDCLQFLYWLNGPKGSKKLVVTPFVQKLKHYYPGMPGRKVSLQNEFFKFLDNVSLIYKKLSSQQVTSWGIYKGKPNDILEALLECTPKLLAALSFIQYHVDGAFNGVGGGDWASKFTNSGDFQKFLISGNNILGGGFSAGELSSVQGSTLVEDLKTILNKDAAKGKTGYDHHRNVIMTTLEKAWNPFNTGNTVLLVYTFCRLVNDERDPNGGEFKTALESSLGRTICWQDLKDHCQILHRHIKTLTDAGFSFTGMWINPQKAVHFAEKVAKWFRENLPKAADVLKGMIPHSIHSQMTVLQSFAEDKLYPNGFIFDGSKPRVWATPRNLDDWNPIFQRFLQLDGMLQKLKIILDGYNCGADPVATKAEAAKPTATKTAASKSDTSANQGKRGGGNQHQQSGQSDANVTDPDVAKTVPTSAPGADGETSPAGPEGQVPTEPSQSQYTSEKQILQQQQTQQPSLQASPTSTTADLGPGGPAGDKGAGSQESSAPVTRSDSTPSPVHLPPPSVQSSHISSSSVDDSSSGQGPGGPGPPQHSLQSELSPTTTSDIVATETSPGQGVAPGKGGDAAKGTNLESKGNSNSQPSVQSHTPSNSMTAPTLSVGDSSAGCPGSILKSPPEQNSNDHGVGASGHIIATVTQAPGSNPLGRADGADTKTQPTVDNQQNRPQGQPGPTPSATPPPSVSPPGSPAGPAPAGAPSGQGKGTQDSSASGKQPITPPTTVTTQAQSVSPEAPPSSGDSGTGSGKDTGGPASITDHGASTTLNSQGSDPVDSGGNGQGVAITANTNNCSDNYVDIGMGSKFCVPDPKKSKPQTRYLEPRNKTPSDPNFEDAWEKAYKKPLNQQIEENIRTNQRKQNLRSRVISTLPRQPNYPAPGSSLQPTGDRAGHRRPYSEQLGRGDNHEGGGVVLPDIDGNVVDPQRSEYVSKYDSHQLTGVSGHVTVGLFDDVAQWENDEQAYTDVIKHIKERKEGEIEKQAQISRKAKESEERYLRDVLDRQNYLAKTLQSDIHQIENAPRRPFILEPHPEKYMKPVNHKILKFTPIIDVVDPGYQVGDPSVNAINAPTDDLHSSHIPSETLLPAPPHPILSLKLTTPARPPKTTADDYFDFRIQIPDRTLQDSSYDIDIEEPSPLLHLQPLDPIDPSTAAISVNFPPIDPPESLPNRYVDKYTHDVQSVGMCTAPWMKQTETGDFTDIPETNLYPAEAPRTVRDMLQWLAGLKSEKHHDTLEKCINKAFSGPHSDGKQLALSVNGHNIRPKDVFDVLQLTAMFAGSVLNSIAPKWKTRFSSRTVTPNSSTQFDEPDCCALLCQLRDYVYTCCHQLLFLKAQCKRDKLSGGWKNYEYGSDVSSPNSSLQAFLTDSWDSTFNTHLFDPCNLCLKSRVRMGFRDGDLPSSQQTGATLTAILTPSCGGEDPLLTLASYLNCLTRRTPRTTGELVSFFHNFGNSLHDVYSNKLLSLGNSLSTPHDHCPDWDRLGGSDLGAVLGIRGSESLNVISKHNSKHDHPRTLSTVVGCGSDSANCHPRMFPITYRAYALYSQRFAHTYLSWAVYLPDRLHESLQKLHYDLQKHRGSGKCSSLHSCPDALPLLYTHGFTPPEVGSQVSLKCSDVITKLEEIVAGQPMADLISAMDEFLYNIREPFIFTLVALWSLAFLIFANTMLYRLDILHIRSHLIRTKASHRIDVKALLTKGRKMVSLYKDVDYFDEDPIGQLVIQ